jgi:mannose-6-phosphate isomerase-like protein (cupin superfamily)
VGYRVARLEDIESIPMGEGASWRPVRRTLGLTALGANAYTAASAGDQVIEPHDELSPGAGGHEELYVVLAGRARFEIDAEEVDAPAGTFLRVDVGVPRRAWAVEPATTVLVAGAKPGAALPVSPFEHWYAAQGPYLAGDYERAYEIAAAGLEDWPDHGTLHYQLACYRALAGDPASALSHLRIAVENDPRTREWAREDADLDAIRGVPGFPT